MTSATISPNRSRIRPARLVLLLPHLDGAALAGAPVGAFYSSFRPFTETVRDGYFSLPNEFTLDNYRNAWTHILQKYWNTFLILAPALILTSSRRW